ncbi:MAG: iron-sulfur cluster biosynthesis family protein, partial [Lactococcus garvieae]
MKIIFDKTVSEKLAKFENADFVLDFDHELSEKNEA